MSSVQRVFFTFPDPSKSLYEQFARMPHPRDGEDEFDADECPIHITPHVGWYVVEVCRILVIVICLVTACQLGQL